MSRARLALSGFFSQVVKQHREAKGFSRAALAEKAGLHQTYISLLERGERSPNLDTAIAHTSTGDASQCFCDTDGRQRQL
jgi:DNA-binding XRE family transcriptional regulator